MTKLSLAVVALFAFATAAAAQPPGPVPPDPAQAWLGEPGLKQVPTDAFLFVSVKASKLWDNPASKAFRDWVAEQKGDAVAETLGVPAADIDRLTMFLPKTPPGDSGPMLFVTTRKPYNEARVRKSLSPREGEERPGGRPLKGQSDRVVECGSGKFRWAVFVDDRTLLLLPGELRESGITLIAQLLARKADGPLAAALSAAANHDLTLGFDVQGVSDLVEATGLAGDKELSPFLLLLKAKAGTLTVNFDKTARGKFVLDFPDAATAKRAGPVLEEGIKVVAEQLGRALDRPERGDALENVLVGAGLTILKNAKVAVEGAKVVATADVPYADEVPKLVAAWAKSIRTRGDMVTATNNLKQLALGMHNAHDTYGRFPGDVVGGDKPLAWSWRVQILPFIEQNQLYQKLDLTKPWDDPANLKVLEGAAMPKVFEVPGRAAPKGHTYFRVFTLPKNAKGTDAPLFEEGKRGTTLPAITDGSSNTLMIVEAGEAVPWYKPDVLAYDGALPLPQLGDKDADRFLAALCDGSVRSFKTSKLTEKTLRAIITRAGGEVLDNDF